MEFKLTAPVNLTPQQQLEITLRKRLFDEIERLEDLTQKKNKEIRRLKSQISDLKNQLGGNS